MSHNEYFLSQVIQQKQKSIDSATSRKLNTSTQLLKLVQNVEIDDLLKHAKLVQPNQEYNNLNEE